MTNFPAKLLLFLLPLVLFNGLHCIVAEGAENRDLSNGLRVFIPKQKKRGSAEPLGNKAFAGVTEPDAESLKKQITSRSLPPKYGIIWMLGLILCPLTRVKKWADIMPGPSLMLKTNSASNNRCCSPSGQWNRITAPFLKTRSTALCSPCPCHACFWGSQKTKICPHAADCRPQNSSGRGYYQRTT